MSSLNSMVNESDRLELSGNALNSQLQTIQINNQLIRLRSKLWQVLEHLVSNRNQLVTRQSLIDICWNGNSYTGEQGLTHTICHLRRIIKKFGIDARITTIPKRGYVLQDSEPDYQELRNDNVFSYDRAKAANLNNNINPIN
jgi:DNA-binding winged helix-turn-helix (wHTH) protein